MTTLVDSLQNTTARVIYYSCLSRPKTIPEIAKSWQYQSSAYFYQSNSRALLKHMMDSELIFPKESGKGEQLSANYDIVLLESNISSFFAKLNKDIDIQLIEEEYPEIADGQLDDSFFREYCLNRKPELKLRAQRIRFEQQTINCLSSLWKHNFFKKVFLPLEALSKAYNRSELPQNPLSLLFGITSALCEKLFELEQGKVFAEPPFIYLFFPLDINDALPAILNELDSVANPKDKKTREEFKFLMEKFTEVYNLVKRKILAYGELEDVGSYHIRRFASLMNLDVTLKRGIKQ